MFLFQLISLHGNYLNTLHILLPHHFNVCIVFYQLNPTYFLTRYLSCWILRLFLFSIELMTATNYLGICIITTLHTLMISPL